MNAKFFDRQNQSNPANGVTVDGLGFLTAAELKSRKPYFCELFNEQGYKLLVGVGDPEGCAQYSLNDGSNPYLMAVADVREDSDCFVEFLIGNEATPVPKRYCLPIETIKQITLYFIETGKRDPRVVWEEI